MILPSSTSSSDPAAATPPARLRRWIPLTLAIFLVADVGSRFLSLDLFAFRAWEVMLLGRGPTGPFAVSRTYYNPWSYGDLPNLTGRPDLRQYRPERFTTDSYGFRNPERVRRERLPVSGFVNGDSFVAGCGLSDDKTLSSQLGQILGKTFYNVGGKAPAAPQDIVDIGRRLNVARRIDIHAYLDRWGLPLPGVDPPHYAPIDPGTQTTIDRLRRFWEDFSVPRAKIFVNKQLKEFRAQAPKANAQASVYHLINGRETLMLRKDVEATYAPMRGQAYFPWIKEWLADHDYSVLVVLVPNKYTVYEPLLREVDPNRGRPGWLDELEAYLKKHDVPVLNLTAPFRKRAAEELAHGRYIYWLDDSHWNEEGARYAAELIAAAL